MARKILQPHYLQVPKRLYDFIRARFFDIVFIQKDIFTSETAVYEKLLSRINNKIIFDFDDAIFLNNETKLKEIIKISAAVIAGNDFLAEFARKYNSNVFVIPTSVKLDRYKIRPSALNKTLTIGWTGTSSTLRYLIGIRNIIENAAKQHDFTLKVIYDKPINPFTGSLLKVESIAWKEKTEIEDLSTIDIGLAPLQDGLWEKGKCGFKIIQYMALGIPVIASPVGVNAAIISDGVNGFLAKTESEWAEKLSLLINNPDLRDKFAQAGRETIEQHYSVDMNYKKVLEVLQLVQGR